jgi:hypothetical protein
MDKKIEEHIWYQLCYERAYDRSLAEKYVHKVKKVVENAVVEASPLVLPPPVLETTYTCRKCRNKTRFQHEDGEVVCLECGLVVTGFVDMGNPYRKLPDKEDREHFGKPYDPRFSDSYNNSTQCADEEDRGFISKVDSSDGFGMSTRDSFRDADKEHAFRCIQDVGCNLSLHPQIVEAAILTYCKYRNVREKLQNRAEIMFAALVMALREVESRPKPAFVKVERVERPQAKRPDLKFWTKAMGESWLEELDFPKSCVRPFTSALLAGHDEDDMGRRLLLGNERSFTKFLGDTPDAANLAKRICTGVRVLKG